MWIGVSFAAFFLIILTFLIVDISNDDTNKVVNEETDTVQEISCDQVSLEEDITCIFNQAFTDLKLKDEAVTDHYFVEKYNQTSIEVSVRNEVGYEDIFPKLKEAMKTASKEKELKEFTVKFKNGKGEIIDGFSFIGDDNLKDYNWDDVKWEDVSSYAKLNN
jgi:50S ribosomal subunit-associated GTPase HflX